MKFKIILAILAFISSLSFAAENAFSKEFGYLSSYKEAKAKALEVNKPLMIFFETTSCPWCQKLKNQTLSKEEAYAIVNNSFVAVLLDKEIDEFPKFLMPFVVPTITFVNPKNEEKFFQILGYKALEEMVPLLKEARSTYKKTQP